MGSDYGQYFGEIRLLHDLTTRADERRWRLTAPEARPGRKPIVLYLGCNVLRTSHMIQTVTSVFDRLGLDYVALGGPTSRGQATRPAIPMTPGGRPSGIGPRRGSPRKWA